jgi:hypothetical protein
MNVGGRFRLPFADGLEWSRCRGRAIYRNALPLPLPQWEATTVRPQKSKSPYSRPRLEEVQTFSRGFSPGIMLTGGSPDGNKATGVVHRPAFDLYTKSAVSSRAEQTELSRRPSQPV